MSPDDRKFGLDMDAIMAAVEAVEAEEVPVAVAEPEEAAALFEPDESVLEETAMVVAGGGEEAHSSSDVVMAVLDTMGRGARGVVGATGEVVCAGFDLVELAVISGSDWGMGRSGRYVTDMDGLSPEILDALEALPEGVGVGVLFQLRRLVGRGVAEVLDREGPAEGAKRFCRRRDVPKECWPELEECSISLLKARWHLRGAHKAAKHEFILAKRGKCWDSAVVWKVPIPGDAIAAGATALGNLAGPWVGVPVGILSAAMPAGSVLRNTIGARAPIAFVKGVGYIIADLSLGTFKGAIPVLGLTAVPIDMMFDSVRMLMPDMERNREKKVQKALGAGIAEEDIDRVTAPFIEKTEVAVDRSVFVAQWKRRIVEWFVSGRLLVKIAKFLGLEDSVNRLRDRVLNWLYPYTESVKQIAEK